MSKKVFDNRELSWLKFNERVLEEAMDENVPLLERLMFESIFSSNLDEFFMVRVGSLYDSSLVDDDQKDNKTKLRPSEQLSAIFSRVRELNAVRDKSFDQLSKELKTKGIHHKSVKNLSGQQAEFIEGYYAYEIEPFINANIIDKRHPFPFLVNKSIYVITKLSAKGSKSLGMISCTDKFKRVVFLPNDEGSDISLDIARAGKSPTVGISGGFGTNTTSMSNDNWGFQLKTNLDFAVGATLSIPILDNRQTKTAMNKAKISEAPLIQLQRVVDNIVAFWGMADDAIDNEAVRSMIKLGKRIERIDLYARMNMSPEELRREMKRLNLRINRTGLSYSTKKLAHLNYLVEMDDIPGNMVVEEIETLIDAAV